MTAAAFRYNRGALLAKLKAAIDALRFNIHDKRRLAIACEKLADALDGCTGKTLQERWAAFQSSVWPAWLAGNDRHDPERWAWGARVIVMARLVVPSWAWTKDVHIMRWIERLDKSDALFRQYEKLSEATANLTWASEHSRHLAIRSGLRILLTRGYEDLGQVTDFDLEQIPSDEKGTDVLDAALCSLGVFDRTPQRGSSRKNRRGQKSVDQLIEIADIPERFRQVTALYLTTYETRISNVYVTRHHKVISLAHFWRFIAKRYPDVQGSADVKPSEARAYIPVAIERAREVRRGRASDDSTRPRRIPGWWT